MVLQFVTALTSNIQALTNSSVMVVISGITAGANASVTVLTSVTFSSDQRNNAQQLARRLHSFL